MRMLQFTKGISTHETDTWNIARRRSWISNDALDFSSARSTNSVGDISSRGAFEFLRSLLAAALRVFAPSRSRVSRSAGSCPRFFRPSARTKYVESRRSGEGSSSHVFVRLDAEFSVQRVRSRSGAEKRRWLSNYFDR